MRFDWLISGQSKAVLDLKMKAYFNQQKNGRQRFLSKLWSSEGKLYLKWDRGIGKYSGRLRTKILLRRNLMCKLLLSFSQVSFCSVYHFALVLFIVIQWSSYWPISSVHTGNIWTLGFRSVRTSKLRSKYFPLWTSQLVNKSIVRTASQPIR